MTVRYVAFLREKPGKKFANALMSLVSETDDFAVKGREIFNLLFVNKNILFWREILILLKITFM